MVDGADSPLRFFGNGALGGANDAGPGLNLPADSGAGGVRRGDRHLGCANVGFCDGHAKSMNVQGLQALCASGAYSQFVNFNMDVGPWSP